MNAFLFAANKEKVAKITLKYYPLRVDYKCRSSQYWKVELFAHFCGPGTILFNESKENFIIINSILYSTSKVSM